MVMQATKVNRKSIAVNSPDYHQHYGMHYDPFDNQPVDTLYYSLPQWEEHLDLLQYLCHHRNVLLVVTGVSGIGKTTLLNQFVQQVGDTMDIFRIDGNPTLQPKDIVEALAEGFELAWPNQDTLEEQLDAQLMMIQQKKRTNLLIIDQAHQLPIETLKTLLYLINQQSETQMRLHILLCGELQLQDRLLNLHADDNTIHLIELEPMSLEDTERYIQHRLKAAGMEDMMPISSAAIARIHRLSGGIPERINRLAQRTLRNIAATPEEVQSALSFIKINKPKLLGGALLILIIAAIAMFLSSLNKKGDMSQLANQNKKITLTDNKAQNHDLNLPTATPVAKEILLSEEPGATVSERKLSATVVNNNPAPLNNQVETLEAQRNKVSVASNQETAPKPAVPLAPAAAPVMPNNGLLPKPPVSEETASSITKQTPTSSMQDTHTVTEQKTGNKQTSHILTTDIAANEANVLKTKTSSISSPAKAKQNASPKQIAAANTKLKPVAKTPATTKVDAPLKASPATLTTMEQYILAVNPHHFTLQIMGAHNLKKLQSYIAANHLDNNARYFQTSFQGKEWYVLVYGNYATRQEAQAAVQQLPEQLRASKPWARSFAAIQTVIQQASDKTKR